MVGRAEWNAATAARAGGERVARRTWPATREQRRLWFLDRWTSEKATYNSPVTWRFTGTVDGHRVVDAVRAAVARHPVLLSSFDEVDGEPVQVVRSDRELTCALVDLTARDPDEARALVDEGIAAESRRPFDLGEGPLVRAAVYLVRPDECVVHLTFHHIVFDSWSLEVFQRDLVEAYRDPGAVVAPAIGDYGDYSHGQREWLATDEAKRSIDFWRSALEGVPDVVELGRDRPRPREFTHRGETLEFSLGPDVRDSVRAAAQRFGVTPYIVLLAAFTAFVSREGGQRDFVVGSPVAGRSDGRFADVVGLFVNTLVLRSRVSPSRSFEEHVAATRATVLDALQNLKAPFDFLVDNLGSNRDPSYGAVVQVLFAFHETTPPVQVGEGLRLDHRIGSTGTAKFDLTLSVHSGASGYDVEVEYCVDLFDRESAERFSSHFGEILRSGLREPGTAIGSLPMAPAGEVGVVGLWSGVSGGVGGGCVHEWVERWAVVSPSAVAVVCGGVGLSYAELNARANRVAWVLRGRGVGVESLVGVSARRSLDLVVLLLGVLKAGAAYVPVDPGYPVDRVGYLLADSGVSLVLVEPGGVVPEGSWEVLEADLGGPVFRDQPVVDPGVVVVPGNAAYVIYTSGSTGRPKGVVVSHHNVTRLVEAAKENFSFSTDDVWSLFHSYSFDVSVWEMWGALTTGGRLVVVPFWESRDPDEFYELVVREGVTVLSQTPTAFVQFEAVDAKRRADLALRYVIFAGEALDHGSVRRWADRRGWDRPRLVNMYGITETTVHTTFRRLDADDLTRALTQVGRPLVDTGIHLLDENLRPSPLGVVGEIYVSGAGVARGYLGRSALTAQRFVPDSVTGTPGARLYRSGDLARMRSDGRLEYVGRADDMIKIRGFRVELGEIEAVLGDHPGVTGAAVALHEDDEGRPLLVGYVAPAGTALTETELRRWVAAELPDYMVPARFLVLDAVPVTPTGKVDRKLLPVPGADRPGIAQGFDPPVGEVERRLATVWERALGLDAVGRWDNFFELGGDSIRSIKVMGLAADEGIAFTLQDLFRRPTVAGLAEVATSAAAPTARPGAVPFDLVAEVDAALLPDDLVDAYPMAALQVGMVYEMERDPDRLPYHNVDSFEVEAVFEEGAFRRALEHVVLRHPILRTSFALADYSVPMQLVHPHAEMPLHVEDLRDQGRAAQDEVVRAYLERQRRSPFDHARPPLFRMAVHRRSDAVFQWTLTEHHAVFDGWSLHSTIAEIFEVYLAILAGEEPVPQPQRSLYRDFIALEQQAVKSSESEEFWLRRLSGKPVTQLPRWADTETVTFPEEIAVGGEWRYASPEQKYGAVETLLTQELGDGLEELARRCGVQVKVVLLAAYLRAVSHLTASHEVVVGVTANGRVEEVGGEEVRGLFLNTLPLRLTLPDGTWEDLIRAVSAAEQEMLPHRRFPLAALQRKLGGGRLIEANFVYNHFHVVSGIFERGVKFIDGKIDSFTTQRAEPTDFPLNVGFLRNPAANGLLLGIDYHLDVLREDQVVLFRGYLLKALSAMVAEPSQRYLHKSLSSAGEVGVVGLWSGVSGGVGGGCVHEWVERWAVVSPSAVAVVCGGVGLSYAELNARANRVAWVLRGRGVGVESLVGVSARRSLDLVVLLLGVLKAGAAYVPVDPGYPVDRVGYLLADSGVSLVLVEPGGVVPEGSWEVLEADLGGPVFRDQPVVDPGVVVVPGNAAYVIYTSGSTGRPKGVVVSHHNVTRLIDWARSEYALDEGDVWSLFHSYSFDFSVWEMWGALATGGRLVVVPFWESRDPDEFYELVVREGVTVLSQTPTAFVQFNTVDARARADLALRLVVFGGEALDRASVRDWADRRGWDRPRLVDMYGITETTVHVTAQVLDDSAIGGRFTRIGRPVAGLEGRVLDPAGIPVALGATGELHVGGERLARGYLGRPALTAQRFVAATSGARLYRSGDLVVQRPDGALEYVGRADDMVNLRGFRIEPGEIEATLAGHPAVAGAVVVLRHDAAGGPALAGYVVPKDGAEDVDARGVRKWLRERLPEHMVPSWLRVVPELPRTPTGKVDKDRLPNPEPEHAVEPLRREPRTPEEELLCGLFAELLGKPEVGADDNFFELGGDSIVSIQLVGRARKAGIPLTPRDVHQNPTPAALAHLSGRARPGTPDAPDDGLGHVPLTPIMHWVESFAGPVRRFAQSVLLKVPGELTEDALTTVLQAVLDRHDVLRARAVVDAARTSGLDIAPPDAVRAGDHLVRVDVSGTREEALPAVAEEQLELAVGELDPAKGVVFRAVWLDGGPTAPHRLLLVVHHLAVDGVSWRILMSDLAAAWAEVGAGRAPALEPVATSFRTWARRLVERAHAPDAVHQLNTWTGVLDRAETSLGRRPLDPRVDVEGSSRTIAQELPPDLVEPLLTTVAGAFHAGVDDLMLAALAVAVAEWRDRRGADAGTSLLVDVERHGREAVEGDVDLSRTVGWFTSLHPVRLDAGQVDRRAVEDGGAALGRAVKLVKEQLRAVPNNGFDYGLLRYLNHDTGAVLARCPQAQVGFNYLGRFAAGTGADWAAAPGSTALRGLSAPDTPLPHVLEVAAITSDETGGPRMTVLWTWPGGVLDEADVADLSDTWRRVLDGLVAHAGKAGAGGHTPSDLTLTTLSQDEVDEFEEQLAAEREGSR
ncbi:amino acid adenylation domain-containing protein [Saccharothrix sp. HUAS TT1]|uniref:amino acid adenylation domain-containing protein n=1 Tax=unclassified Saccharothrix TaxID=2593673 RepID=UPI00345BB2CD